MAKKNEVITGEDVETIVCSGGGRADSWEVEIPTIESCSKAPTQMVANISVLAKSKIDALMEKYPNIEWLAYLIGDKSKPLDVEDIFIPEQDITATSVDNIQCPEFNTLSILGVMHSHHGMGTGFSGTDHNWINQNHNLSIVVAKDGIAGQFRWSTPCGGMKIVPVKCRVKYDFDFNKEEFLQQATPKIKQKSYVGTGTGRSWQGGSYQNGQWQPGNYPGRVQTVDQARYVAGVSVKSAASLQSTKGFEDEQSLVEAMEEAFALETSVTESGV